MDYNIKYIVTKEFVDKLGCMLPIGYKLESNKTYNGQMNGYEFRGLNKRHVISSSDLKNKMVEENEYLKKKLDIILGQS